MKSKNTAAVLAFFLGGLGVHKFYLNKTGQGVFYLLLSWTLIPAMIAFIEAIVLLTMSESTFEQKYMPEQYQQKMLALRLESEIRKEEAERLESEAHLKAMQDKYGEEAGLGVHEHRVWIGMTKEMLTDSIGPSQKDKRHFTEKSMKEKCYYGEYMNSRGNASYRLEVQLENEKVIGIKEL